MPRRPATRLRLTSLEDRLTPAGGLDPTFGTGGIVQAATTGGGSRAEVAFQPDGRLLVLSRSGASPVDPVHGASDEVARFLPDGSPDLSFGVNGRAAPLAGQFFASASMAVAPDGKIVLFGNAMAPGEWYGKSTVVRLNANGSLDTAFGVGGSVPSVQLPLMNSLTGSPTGLVVRPDGSVVVAGTDGGQLVLTQFDSAGAPDTTFGTGGRYAVARDVTRPYSSVSSFQMALLPDGRLVVASDLTDFANPLTPGVTEVVTKLTAAGALDTSFSGDGVWSSAVEGQGVVTGGWSALAVQADGKLILTGVGPMQPGDRSPSLFALRLNADGTTDAGFGANGQAVVQAEGVWGGYVSLGLLSDGRIVVGASRNFQSAGGTVSVLNPDGTPDDYFADGSGHAQVAYGPGGLKGQTSVGDLAVLNDRIAVVSAAYDDTARDPSGGSQSFLGLAMLAERPDALPTYTAPLIETPPEPPVVGEPPVIVGPPVVGGEGVFVVPPMPGEERRGEVIAVEIGPDGLIIGEYPARTGGTPPVALPVPRVPGDVNGDGVADKVVTAGSTVSVVSGSDGVVLVKAFAPFEASYTGTLNAVFVDVDGDGKSELVVSPGQGGGPVVAVYNADGTERGRFWGIDDAGFRGGVNLAAGDTNADGRPDLIVTAGEGGGPRVAIFDGKTLGASPKRLVADFFAFEASQTGGATAGVANGVLIFGAGPGGGPRVRGVDGSSLFTASGVRSLDDLPASARRFDRFVGDASSRQGVKLDLSGVDNSFSDHPNKVTATGADGKPVIVFESTGYIGRL